MKEYVKIENSNIEFKNLLSGPAQIGKMLNYVIYAGENSLKHKSGQRDDNLENNVGNAWCLEFMIGLGIVELGEKVENTNISYVNLTNDGKELYNNLVENAIKPTLDYSSNNSTLAQLKEANALNIINVFEKIFRKSIIFKDLCIYLDVDSCSKDYISMDSNDFKENLFGELKSFYNGHDYVYEGNGASTGGNRVPSLIQLLEFLNYAKIESKNIVFNIKALKSGIFNPDYKLDISDEHLIKELNKEETIINKLIEEFGLDGNRIVTEKVRLSQAQLIFKERLRKEYGSKCWLCGIENEQLLIASHIKDSAKCDIHGKTDNNNGLLLCAMHDKLFDLSLISFDFKTGKILISDKLNKNDQKLCNVNEFMALPEKIMSAGRSQYLIWHNNEFYSEKNK